MKRPKAKWLYSRIKKLEAPGYADDPITQLRLVDLRIELRLWANRHAKVT